MNEQDVRFLFSYSEDDLALYRLVGYTADPQIPEYTPENWEEPEPLSWEDLIAVTSSWREFLLSPEEYAAVMNKRPGMTEERINKWVEERESLPMRVKEAREDSEYAIVTAFLRQPRLSVKARLSFCYDNESGYHTKDFNLGEVIAVSKPEQEQVLNLVNKRPWGRNGSFQVLANISGLPIRGFLNGSDLTGKNYQEYLPKMF